MAHRLTCFRCAGRDVIIANFIAVPRATDVCHGGRHADVAGTAARGEAEGFTDGVLRDAEDGEPDSRVLFRGEDATDRRVVDAFRAEGVDESSEFLGGLHGLTISFRGGTLHSVGQISHVLPPALDPGDEEAIGLDGQFDLLRWGGLDGAEDAGDHSGIDRAVCAVRHGGVVLAPAAAHAAALSGVGTNDLGGSDFLDVHELTIPQGKCALHFPSQP